MVSAVEHRPVRVTLRRAEVTDAPLLRRWRSEDSVREFQPLQDASVSQLRAEVAALRTADVYRGRGERFLWIVEVDGVPAGWVTLVVTNWEHGLSEIGYALSTPFQGQGVMTAALSQLLPDLLFRSPLERIEARCAFENSASQRVLEKLGFVREGLLRGYFSLRGQRVDHVLFALLKQDYVPG